MRRPNTGEAKQRALFLAVERKPEPRRRLLPFRLAVRRRRHETPPLLERSAPELRLRFVIADVPFLILLSACAGRAPELTPLVQPTDQVATCDQIMTEIKANNARITDLANEEGWKVGQNVAAGVVGLVIWPVWFGMDFQDAAGKEGKSLSQRNEYLGTLAQQHCNRPVERYSPQR